MTDRTPNPNPVEGPISGSVVHVDGGGGITLDGRVVVELDLAVVFDHFDDELPVPIRLKCHPLVATALHARLGRILDRAAEFEAMPPDERLGEVLAREIATAE